MRLLGPCYKTGQFTISTPSQHLPLPLSPTVILHHPPSKQGTQWQSTISLFHNTQSMTAPSHIVHTHHNTIPYKQCHDTHNTQHSTYSQLLPASQLQALPTLFPKFLPTFLHSTCLLSASHLYLASHGIYHHLYIALSSNMTPQAPCPPTVSHVPTTGLSPPMASFSLGTSLNVSHSVPQSYTHHESPPCHQYTMVSCLWAPILFTRRYKGYHSYFLFLYLLRCFNSIGL